MFKKVLGTKDILPDQAALWQNIEETSRKIFSLYNFKEIRTPLIEEAALFNRSLGRSTEIVTKQMFLIKNKDGLYALRPEATVSIVRAYIENNLDKTAGFTKLYYLGPMFRFERPQKGRLRQFHHIGCEAIGSQDADLDVEIISLAENLLKAINITGYLIKINSLGCLKDKKNLTELLNKRLKDKLKGLCADCKTRFKTNILRVLDCKDEACKKVIAELGLGDAYLCAECKTHFSKVKAGLDSLGVNYEVSHNLVRGLDYYTRTVFEIIHNDLGGPDLGAIGFAFGVERLLLATSHKPQATSKNLIYLITLGEEAKKEGIKILENLRRNQIACDTDYENKSIKGAMRVANDLNAGFTIIIGEDELKKGVLTLKDMVSGEQKEVKQEDLVKEVK